MIENGIIRRDFLAIGANAFLITNACRGELSGTLKKDEQITQKVQQTQRIGAAIRSQDLNQPAFIKILRAHCNLISREREQKMALTWIGPNSYDFQNLARISAFAIQSGMALRGHTLIWHRSIPQWLIKSAPMDRTILLDHIAEYLDNLKGFQFSSFDVVNEALSDHPIEAHPLRQSFWLKHLGSDYIAEIFRLTASAMPTTPLVYNDYGLEYGGPKQDAAITLFRSLLESGVPLAGIGLQSHLFASPNPKYPSLPKFLNQIENLGLDIYLTELDVSCNHLAEDMPLEEIDEMVNRSATEYLSNFKSPVKELVTWGLWDNHTNLNGKNYRWQRPLPFDIHGEPKPLFGSLQKFLEQ